MRKPARKTAPASRTQYGQTTRPRAARPVQPIHAQRASRYASGMYTSGTDAKTFPRLKNHSDTENDSSISRSRFRHDSGRRNSASPSRKAKQNPSQTE